MAAFSKKKGKGLLTLLIVGAVGFFFWNRMNPNNKKWTNEKNEMMDMSQYPLVWFPFSSKITIAGRTDISGVMTGNQIKWSNNSTWTAA